MSGLFVNTRAKVPVPGKGKEVENIGRTVQSGQSSTLHSKESREASEPHKPDRIHGQSSNLGSIRGESVKVVKASGQGRFNHEGKFPPNGNQQKPKNRISFDVKAVGDASRVPTGPQDAKQTLAENQKKKRTAAQVLYPKHRSVMAVEAA